MKAPGHIVARIALAVEAQGGDMLDVEDLIRTWITVHGYPQPDEHNTGERHQRTPSARTNEARR